MKKILKQIPLAILGMLFLLLPACSKSTTPTPAVATSSLQIGKEYQNSEPSVFLSNQGNGYNYSSTIYIFGSEGVSVYRVIASTGNVYLNKNTGVFSMPDSINESGGSPKGAQVDGMEVVLSTGDRMPVLENAPYKVIGTSVQIDWSQQHSKYFSLSGCSSDSEVFTIKNDGLVLESASSPGFNLTLK